MAIRTRRGNKADFDPNKMLGGELGIAIDTKEAFLCFAPGDTKKMSTYEDMSQDIIKVTSDIQEQFTDELTQKLADATIATNAAVDAAELATANAEAADLAKNRANAAAEAAEGIVLENIATETIPGIVKGGGNVKIAVDGTLSVDSIDVDIATDTTAGIVKGGGNVIIEEGGTLNFYESPISFRKVKFIAHRGYSSLVAENGLYAFELSGSVRGNFWGCETDLRQTSDGEWICMHDETIDRTTNGSGAVSSMTLAQIKTYSIDYPALFGTLPEIPTFEQYLAILASIDVVPVIELKVSGNYQKIIDALKKYGFEDKCIVISFSSAYLQALRNLSTKVKMQLLVNTFTQTDIDVVKDIKNCGISVSSTILTQELVTLVHSNDLEVGVWTIDDVVAIENAVKYGVDYITTNKGAGRFTNKSKRFTLNKSASNTLQIAQSYSSEDAVLSWDATRQAVKITYEYPFKGMAGCGSSSFISMHTGTKDLGYTFATQSETSESVLLRFYKNSTIINPLDSLTDGIFVSVLVPSY